MPPAGTAAVTTTRVGLKVCTCFGFAPKEVHFGGVLGVEILTNRSGNIIAPWPRVFITPGMPLESFRGLILRS